MDWPSPFGDLPPLRALRVASAAFLKPDLPPGFVFRSALLPGARPPPPLLNEFDFLEEARPRRNARDEYWRGAVQQQQADAAAYLQRVMAARGMGAPGQPPPPPYGHRAPPPYAQQQQGGGGSLLGPPGYALWVCCPLE
jgi:hypothetical protein